MNKTHLFVLSAFFILLNFSIPAGARCAVCDDDKAAESKSDGSSAACTPAKKADKATCQTCKAEGKKSVEKRVSDLEQRLKDVGSCEAAGSPFPGKSKDYGTKSAQCAKTKSS